MLQTLDQMFTAAPAVVPPPNRTWAAIPGFLKKEIAAGASSSARKKAQTAVNSLLKARKLTPENAPIDLDWFDRVFPVDGWDPTMPFELGAWIDYRYRVRPVIERMTGADVEKKALLSLDDTWTEVGSHLTGLEMFAAFGAGKRLIPVVNTLTMGARRAGLSTRDIDQPTFQKLHDDSHGNEKRSLRSASELIAELQSTTSTIWTWFPHAIEPIEAAGAFQYDVPPQLEAEVAHFVELASRKRYIRVKKQHEYVSKGTRTNFTTTMHAAVDGLIAVGRLRRNANGFTSVLEDPESAAVPGGVRQFFVVAIVEFIDALTKGDVFGWSGETTKRYACSMRAIARAMVEMSEDKGFDINAFCIDEFDLATVTDLVQRRAAIVEIATVNRDLTALGHFMIFCKNRQWIDANPVAAYEKQGMKEVLPPITLPTSEALAKMINRGPQTFGCLVRFIDKEGTRATETARLTWPDIAFDPNDPTVATATLRHTKGGEPRVITLDPETVAMLRAMPRSNRWPYVFFNDGDEGWYRDLSTRFWQYGQDVQFAARLHDLRHGFAIRKLKANWSIYRVSAHLGHRSVTTTERYYFRYLTEEQRARARNSGNNGFA